MRKLSVFEIDNLIHAEWYLQDNLYIFGIYGTIYVGKMAIWSELFFYYRKNYDKISSVATLETYILYDVHFNYFDQDTIVRWNISAVKVVFFENSLHALISTHYIEFFLQQMK